MEFEKGSKVEFCTFDPGFEGAWFAGEVIGIKKLQSCHKITLKLEHFVKEDGKPYNEHLCSSQVRPRPPEIPLPKELAIGDAVEAFHSGCWWHGHIMEVLSSSNTHSQRYLVYFHDTDTWWNYTREDLRPCQEWIRRRWILPQRMSSDQVEEILRTRRKPKDKEKGIQQTEYNTRSMKRKLKEVAETKE